MSGTFEKLDVPPTLVSFAITTENAKNIVSPEYKAAGHPVLWLKPQYRDELPEKDALLALFRSVHQLVLDGKLASIYTPTYGGVAEAVLKQCMGNELGFDFAPSLSVEDIFSYQYGSFLLELTSAADRDAIYQNTALQQAGIIVADLGVTTDNAEIRYNDETLKLSDLEDSYEDRLEKVFSCNMNLEKDAENERAATDVTIPDHVEEEWIAPAVQVAKPHVLIPVFPGNNCEYDSAKACADAGLEPEIIVVRNMTKQDISDSVEQVAKRIAESQMIFIPGGFSGGDEPDGSAKFITSFFRNEAVKNATMDMLNKRDGLMLGICNGFQALIKLGLVPYGEIRDTDAHCPTLTFNTIGRHQSKIVRVRVASNMSPWLEDSQPGDIYSVPISHGEGRFLCEPELFQQLVENGQIATQYVDLEGHPTMDIQYNPNGSYYAVEGITSPDGRVFGKMGHAERWDDGLYKNVPGNYDMGLFRAAKEYFN